MPMPRPLTLRTWLAFGLALVAAALAMWIVVPAPNSTLLPLGVGAPEVSVWLVVLGAGALTLSAYDLRRSRLARVAAAFAIGSIGLASVPLLRFRAVAEQAERDLRTALGGGYLDSLPVAYRATLSTYPLVWSTLFRPFSTPVSARVTRGIRLAVHDRDTLTLDVYEPAGAAGEAVRDSLRHPVLVQVYGGAWQRGEPANNSDFAEYMARQGFVVFAVDYRHAPSFRFPTQVDDVRHALAWIGANAATWHADTSRLVLIGRSAGAHLAMMAAYAVDAPRVRAVVNYYGPVDLTEGYRQPPRPDPLAVREIEEAFLGGTPSDVPEVYQRASPISLVTRKLPPTLLIYGGRDHIVEPRFGTLLAGRLRAEGTTVVHVEIPWAEHAFDAVPNGPSGQLSRYVTERFIAWAVTRD
jgi:acetyl esterase/lipase